MDKKSTSAPSSAAQTDLPSAPRDGLSVKELARAVLDRTLRPRTTEVRRLAEAVLERAKAGKKKLKKSKAGKDDGKTGDKKRKQAKIPGQLALAGAPLPAPA